LSESQGGGFVNGFGCGVEDLTVCPVMVGSGAIPVGREAEIFIGVKELPAGLNCGNGSMFGFTFGTDGAGAVFRELAALAGHDGLLADGAAQKGALALVGSEHVTVPLRHEYGVDGGRHCADPCGTSRNLRECPGSNGVEPGCPDRWISGCRPALGRLAFAGPSARTARLENGA